MSHRSWTKQLMIDRIQELHRQGIPVGKIWMHDYSLPARSRSLFGSWRNALKAAGFEPSKRQWCEQDIIEAFKARHAQKQVLLRKQVVNPNLNSAARRHFGSIRAAKEAAGVPCRPQSNASELWTEARVIEAILSLNNQGIPPTSIWRHNAYLCGVGKRVFGRWSKALEIAGFPVAKKKPFAKPEEVIHMLREHYQKRETISDIWNSDPRLYKAVKKHFGNLAIALEVAGLPVTCRRVWSKTRVLTMIRSRHQQGPPLSQVWKDDPRLYAAATRYFKNWKMAIKAAGILVKVYKRWSKERIIDALQETYRGQSDFRFQYPTLTSAAHRFFGSFFQALDAAGLERPVKRWTKHRVIECIQQRYIEKAPLEKSGFGDRRLAQAAQRHFGCWREAVKAAGLESRLSPEVKRKLWTREMVIEEIRAIAASESGLSRALREHRQFYRVASRLFGTWNGAVRSAGLQPARRRWTTNVVLDEIRARHAAGLTLWGENNLPLRRAAKRRFGSWQTALEAAGISYSTSTIPPISRRKSKNVA